MHMFINETIIFILKIIIYFYNFKMTFPMYFLYDAHLLIIQNYFRNYKRQSLSKFSYKSTIPQNITNFNL